MTCGLLYAKNRSIECKGKTMSEKRDRIENGVISEIGRRTGKTDDRIEEI